MKRGCRGHLLIWASFPPSFGKNNSDFCWRLTVCLTAPAEGGHVIQLGQRIHWNPSATGMWSRISTWNKSGQSEWSPEHLSFKLPSNSRERRAGSCWQSFLPPTRHRQWKQHEGERKPVWRENRLWWQSLSPWISLCQKPALGLLHSQQGPFLPKLVWVGSSVIWNQKALKLIKMYSSQVICVRLFLNGKTIVPLPLTIKLSLRNISRLPWWLSGWESAC